MASPSIPAEAAQYPLIYSVVKQGLINLAFESERMAIPKAKLIGLSSADPDRYGLPRGLKYEIDALASKDFRYLTKTSLPRKLKEVNWLE